MKLSEKLARLKWSKRQRAGRQAGQVQRAGLKPGRVVLAILAVLVTAGATWAVLHFFVWQKVPAALVGTWQVKDGPMQGGTFTFSSNGTVAIRSGQGQDIHARVAVTGKKMTTSTTNAVTGREETRTSTIQELTENVLLLELEKGAVLRMEKMK